MNIQNIIFITFISTLGWFSTVSAGTHSGAKLYKTECSDCHIAYPTLFLPSASWNKLLNHLDNHFGDNAEVDAADLKDIKSYINSNNYDNSSVKRRYGSRFDTSGTPLRVTKTRFFKAIHGEVSDRYVSRNPAVKTFARCEACHRSAKNGSFDEDEVRIPR